MAKKKDIQKVFSKAAMDEFVKERRAADAKAEKDKADAERQARLETTADARIQLARLDQMEKDRKEADKEEYEAGKEHALGLAYKAKVRKERFGKVVGVAEKSGMAPITILKTAAGAVRPSRLRIGLPKGIRHPDSLIKNKELYFGSSTGTSISPIGRQIDNPMELYFGRGSTQKDAKVVLGALQSGASDLNSISVMTGLKESRVEAALKELERQGAFDPQYVTEESE